MPRPQMRARGVGSWTSDAVAAMQANSTYFAWWYTVKSVGLVVAIALAAYAFGRLSVRRR